MEKEKIILLHGAIGSKLQLEDLEKELCNTFEVYTFNFEGHGDISSNNDFSIDLFTQNLADYIFQNNLDGCCIFGYSMGGYVALNFAKNYSGNIKKIITYGTKFNWTYETALLQVKTLDPVKIQEKVPQFAELLKLIHVSNDWKIVLEKTSDMMLRLGNGEALKEIDFRQIKTPVLLLVGSLDTMVSVEESEIAATYLKGASVEILKDFTHPIERNDMKILAEIITNF